MLEFVYVCLLNDLWPSGSQLEREKGRERERERG